MSVLILRCFSWQLEFSCALEADFLVGCPAEAVVVPNVEKHDVLSRRCLEILLGNIRKQRSWEKKRCCRRVFRNHTTAETNML